MEGVPELRHEERDVLVKGVEYDFGDAVVGPSAMHEEQFAQVFELRNCNICGPGCLEAFHARYTNADVSSLNHGDIVCAVADGEEDSLQVAFY